MAKTKTIDTSTPPALRDALREARVAEAAQFEAELDLRDAQSIRLQLLKDELLPIASETDLPEGLIDLALVPSIPPRLWIDPVTHVVMEPNPQTYRLLQDGSNGRENLFESSSLEEMAARIRTHVAHRLVTRERRRAGASDGTVGGRGYSGASLILAWSSGFAVGVLALFISGILLSRI